MSTKLKKMLIKKKTEWDKRNVSFKTLVAAEKQIYKRTRRCYKHENNLFVKCMNLHMDSIGYAFDIIAKDEKDLFHDAFLRLGVKIQHNADAIRNLFNIGLYGSGWTTYRTLLFDTHMIWYLYFNPHLIEEWTKEKFDTYKDKKWRHKFSEGSIIKNLEERGKEHKLFLDYETDFAFYSKASHPTYFGIRFFQNENGELAYLPSFSMKAGHLLFLKVLGLLPYPTHVLLEKNKININTDHRLAAIRMNYNHLMVTLNAFGKVAVKFQKEVLGAREAKDITKT